MPCSINFSMTLQAEILSIETSDFLKQIIFSSLLFFSVLKELASRKENFFLKNVTPIDIRDKILM